MKNQRLRTHQAIAILVEEIEAVGGSYEPNLTRTDGPRVEANDLAWWYSGNVEEEGSITPRTLALVRAYLRIAGDAPMYAQGLLLFQGRVHMDKYVVRRLHKDGYLSFVEAPYAYFELTPLGKELVAPQAG